MKTCVKTAPAITPTSRSAPNPLVRNVGDGICNDGSGNCTLRAAIQQVNATPVGVADSNGSGETATPRVSMRVAQAAQVAYVACARGVAHVRDPRADEVPRALITFAQLLTAHGLDVDLDLP